jgi:hypothetical protein
LFHQVLCANWAIESHDRTLPNGGFRLDVATTPLSTTHPLRADEVKAIKAWLKERERMKPAAAVKTLFISEQRKPLHRSTVNLLLKTASAALPFAAHPHMLGFRQQVCDFLL